MNAILRSNLLLVVLIIFIHQGCVEQIDIKPPVGLSESIVVQGRAVLGESSSFVEVKAKRLFDFTGESRLNLNLKRVALNDTNGNSVELEQDGIERYYVVLDENSPITLLHGEGYFLELITFDNRTYRSEVDVLPPNDKVAEVSFAIKEQWVINSFEERVLQDKLEVMISTSFGPNNFGFLWEPTRTFKMTDRASLGSPNTCYVTENISVLSLPSISDKDTYQAILRDISVARLSLDSRMKEGMYVNVKQYSLSEGAAKYWGDSKSLAENTGGFFDDPVGELGSNFINVDNPDDVVYGYFFATDVNVYNEKVPDGLIDDLEANFSLSRILTSSSGGCQGICCNCPAFNNSTISRPDYWIE